MDQSPNEIALQGGQREQACRPARAIGAKGALLPYLPLCL